MTTADLVIRRYRHADRDVVRRICADTGFLGQPIDAVFEDRELFADYLTNYYLSVEPDAAFVCELDGEVRGYLLGCCRPMLNQAYQALSSVPIAARAMHRLLSHRYGGPSRAFLRWVALRAWREIPAAPRFTAHFHINLMPEARSVKYTRLLIQSFLHLLHERGRRHVFGQMVTYERRRTENLFVRYGFRLLHRVEITKFRNIFAGRIFLSTVVRDLSDGPLLLRSSQARSRTRMNERVPTPRAE